MPRRHSFERARDDLNAADPDFAGLSEDERRRFTLERLCHLVAIRDAQGDGHDRAQEALLHRSIESVFRDCEALGLTREACAILEEGPGAAWAP